MLVDTKLPLQKKRKKEEERHLMTFFKRYYSLKKGHELVGVIYFATLGKCRATTGLDFFFNNAFFVSVKNLRRFFCKRYFLFL
jgi:hypothetical protein